MFTDMVESGAQGRGVLGSIFSPHSSITVVGVGLAPGERDFAGEHQLLLRSPQLRPSIRISLLISKRAAESKGLAFYLPLKDRSFSRHQAKIAWRCHVPGERSAPVSRALHGTCHSLQAPAYAETMRCWQSEDRKPQAISVLGWAEGTTGKVQTHGDLNQAKTTAIYRQTKELPYRKCYGFKLAKTCWWMMSKVWDCN